MDQLSFQSLCKKLRNSSFFGTSADDLNTLMGAIASLLGDPAAGGVSAFVKALAEKEKLISLGKTVLDRICAQKPVEYSGRVDQMKAVYGMICYTAFFDTLDQQLPDSIRCSIQISPEEKKALSGYSPHAGNSGHVETQEIVFPDIVCGYTEVDQYLETLYKFMAGRVKEFVNGLSFRDNAEEKDILNFSKIMEDIPSLSIKRFHDQYLALCSQFNEFYIYTNLEREKTQKLQWEKGYEKILSVAMCTQNSVEAGLESLEKISIELPNQIKKEKVQAIVDALIKTYRDSINRSLIETKDHDEKLTYPLISTAFVPQAYKLLRYSGEEHLEEPETWKNLSEEQDMMSFWAKYCLDPGSVENLLLILGEPGGGKSLLTKILCARMITPTNMFIRIPLREHDVEDDIESIVCQQIQKDGDASESIQTFKWFAEEFQGNPITLLFDGYDEVMQATGGVYRNLLKKIQRFQEHCYEQHRPVRIVVTSRETLIDKADIPKNTTVMKLLEFDKPRKDQWIEIWNWHNHTALVEAGIEDFSLPERNRDIEELSGQPLLLLMLAIYDANFETRTNALKQKDGEAKSLDRTKLYDELLRRFIRRELRKGPRGQDISFNDVDDNEQIIMVDEEMKKLGIAALGMFAREKLSLTVGELEDDLAYMKTRVTDYSGKNKKTLKNAETVFGSFFFIHDSRTENSEDEKEAEFEFLHKTFYEFLVADLILQYLIDAMDDLNERKHSAKWGETHYSEALDKPDSLDDPYYAALNSACLCTEPEIIQMISEWKDSKLNQYFRGEQPQFGEIMDQVIADLFGKHAAMIRTGVFVPFIKRKDGTSGGRHYLQACAVYLMNLLILRILTSGQCRLEIGEWRYISQFLKLNAPLPKKEKRDKSIENQDRRGARKVKIAPSEEIILKFMALFQIKRDGAYVVLTKRIQTRKFERDNLQEARMDVFDFIQDDITWKVYQLHSADSNFLLRQKYRHALDEQGFDLDFELAVAQLHKIALYSDEPDYHELDSAFQQGIQSLIRNDYADVSLVLDWLLCLRLLIRRIPKENQSRYQKISERLHYWEMMGDVILHRYADDKQIVLIYLEIITEIGCGEALIEGRWLEKMLGHLHMSPDTAVALIEALPYGNARERIFRRTSIFFDRQGSWLPSEQIDSPKVIGALLKMFYVDGGDLPSNALLRKIQKKWEQYLYTAPDELPKLLEVYLQMGRLKEVRSFLGEIENGKIRVRLDWRPETMSGFLGVAQAVGEAQSFGRYLVQQMRGELTDGEVLRCPSVAMQLLRYMRGNKQYPSWASHFLRRYDDMFHADPKEAVEVLFEVFRNEGMFNSEWIPRAYGYSLKYYGLLVETSVTAAAHLLIMIEELEESKYSDAIREPKDRNLRYPDSYIERCFNRALFLRSDADVPSLIELLDCIDAGTKRNLGGFFVEKYSYIQAYSLELAKRVDKVFCLS